MVDLNRRGFICGRPRLASGLLSEVRAGACSHMSGLFVQASTLLAMMKSASQVPDKSTCSKHERIPRGVLITGSPFRSSLPHCTCQPKALRRRLWRTACSVNFSGSHDRPCNAGQLVGQRYHHKLGWATFEKLFHPVRQRPLPLVKPTQMCRCGKHQKLAKIGITLLADPPQALFATT